MADKNSLFNRQVYTSIIGYFSTSHSFMSIMAASGLFIVALFLRSWENIIHPGLYMEDATHYFNFYYGAHLEPSSIFQKPNGYYNVINNFVAWVVSHLDVRVQPLLYSIFSLSFGIGTAICFVFTGILRNRIIILIAPLLLGLSGMNHIYYFSTLTFQMYNVAILLLVLLLAPIPRSSFAVTIATICATLLVWSGPYSVVALPACLLLLIFFKNEHKTPLILITIVNIVIYALSVDQGTIRLINIVDPGLRNIVTNTFFDKIIYLDLIDEITTTHRLIFFVSMLTIFYSLRKNIFFVKLSIIILVIVLSALAPFFLSIKFPLYRVIFPAHLYVSQFFWLCFLLITLDQLFEKFKPALSHQITISIFLLCFVVWDNILHPSKGSKKIMSNLPAFLNAIHTAEKLTLHKQNLYIILSTENVVPKRMRPTVRVGSRSIGAQRLRKKEAPPDLDKRFIKN